MLGDVRLGEVLEVRSVDEADFAGFLERGIPRHPVADDAADQPEGAHPDRRGAVNEHGAVRLVVGDLEERVHIRIRGLAVFDGNVEIPEPRGFDRRLRRFAFDAYLFWGAEYWMMRQQAGDPGFLRAFARVLDRA